MGRGNVCVLGDYEGLYYVDFDNFECYREGLDGSVVTDRYKEPEHDYDMERAYLDDAIDEFQRAFCKRFPSFQPCEKWLGNECRAILENRLFYIAVTDNMWSEAFMLLQKEQNYYIGGNYVTLQYGLYDKYLAGMRECLFQQFEELGTYTGPWTSGRIRKEPMAA